MSREHSPPNTARPQSGVTFAGGATGGDVARINCCSNRNPSARAVTAMPPVGRTRTMRDSPLDQFQAFLDQRGQRLTRERRLIAVTVFTLAPPFDMESVLAAVRETTSQRCVSRATVYRTLDALEQSGLVSIQSSAKASPVYWHTFTPPTPSPQALCASTHLKLIAGRCPWCGRELLNHNPRW